MSTGNGEIIVEHERHISTMTRSTILLMLALASGAYGQDAAVWSNMRYRMIGPERGGRVTAVTGVPSEPYTFYMGSTGGGVWKTTDAGHTWVNVSDGQIPVGSMGAIEVSLSDPNVVYAGTGSSKIRSNVSIGRGMYKSTDAGKTWTFAGLRDVGQIATVRVHPTNPDIVYVAALGNPFAPNKERGVYRTTDGGKTWKNVLFVSDHCRRGRSRAPARQSERGLRLHVARASASPGPSSAARAKAASTKAPMAATPGTNWPAACPTNCSAAATWPSPRPARIASTR